MRTTLDIPEELVKEAMALTGSKTKTEVIKKALDHIIVREKIKGLKNYYGKCPLDIELSELRNR